MNDQAMSKSKWIQQIETLWPAIKGSLAKVYKPCIRKHCPACTRGDKHPAWMLSLSDRGRRRTLYVPLALAPKMRKAIQNGRKIEQLLYKEGLQMVQQYRKEAQKYHRSHLKS